MQRDDLTGIVRAPQHVLDLLLRIGGKNPYGEPSYRYVLAQSVMRKQAGEWHDWRDGDTVQERGGLCHETMGPHPNQPLRVVKEMRTIRRYPICECAGGVQIRNVKADPDFGFVSKPAGDCDTCGGVLGWIVEAWLPAHMFAGSEADWYAAKVPGTDLPRLGPYPHAGEYMRVSGSRATSEIPSLSQIAELVFYLESHKAHRVESPEKREKYMKERLYAEECEQERLRAKQRAEKKERVKQQLEPLHGSSLRAGAEREKYAQRLRERGVAVGHVGN